MTPWKNFIPQKPLWPGRYFENISYISDPPDQEYIQKLPRHLSILGSTGSIGRNALQVVKKDFFTIRALACGYNIDLLAKQAEIYRPGLLAVAEEKDIPRLASLLSSDYRPEILWGPKGYAAIASDPLTDCVLSCQMGMAGLSGTIAACKAGKVVALANKEALVLAGGMLRKIASQSNAVILPVDSEHYAFFQCCSGRENQPDKLLLTASGGPFRGKTRKDFGAITPEQALAHPNWRMGKKISVDSATLMNKGLELIEAAELFGISPGKIIVLVHPQSIIHSLVQFKDNSILAQLSMPDMKLPISGCLFWPYMISSPVSPLDMFSCGALEFEKPDEENFPCLSLAKKAALWKPSEKWQAFGLNPACIALNTANEFAVEKFLDKECSFSEIPVIIEDALQHLIFQNSGDIVPLPGDFSADNGLEAILSLANLVINYISGKSLGSL